MSSFKDSEGRTWTVRITNRTVRDIKDKLGLDIRELLNENMQPLAELLSDSLRMSEVLFVACKEQADKANVTEDQFLDAIFGDISESASKAFSEAFIEFFPNPQIRKAINEILGLLANVRTEIANEATNLLKEADPQSVDCKSIAQSIVSQESSA